jgi:transposase
LPDNISLLPLPPYSPELNPVENVGQFLRQNHLSNRVYESYEAIRCVLRRVERPHRRTRTHHHHRITRLGGGQSVMPLLLNRKTVQPMEYKLF